MIFNFVQGKPLKTGDNSASPITPGVSTKLEIQKTEKCSLNFVYKYLLLVFVVASSIDLVLVVTGLTRPNTKADSTDASKHFNITKTETFPEAWNSELALYYLLWLTVVALGLHLLIHATICCAMFTGSRNPIDLFNHLFPPGILFSWFSPTRNLVLWALSCVVLCLEEGYIFWRLYDFGIAHEVQTLLLLQISSCLMVLFYNMILYEAKSKSSSLNGKLEVISTVG